MSVTWPSGRKFAFTVIDDTDWATLENVKPVYDLLAELGMRTTKSVWIFGGDGHGFNRGSTCEDPDYLAWLLKLQKQGFEIALHNPAPVTSPRERMRLGLARFRELFGNRMAIHCNHLDCRENIYWGDARLTGWRRGLYNVFTNGAYRGKFRGHIEGDPLFWGDLCRQQVRYVRNFVFEELNTLALCPEMPYHDPARPFVNFWFASSNAGSRANFLRNFTLERIDQLAESGGLCIAYAHFAGDFVRDGKVDPEFQRRIEYLASRDGWFVPASDALDYLRGDGDTESRAISPASLRSLEARWLARKVHRKGQEVAAKTLRALEKRWNRKKSSREGE